MKEAAVVACLLAAFVVASEEPAHCPALCRCELRPWFSPRSVYTEAATVDCNDLGLSDVPERLPSETQVLLLQTNNIINVEEALDYLANITEIDLSQNNISSVSDVCLGPLPRLLSLHMEENWIRELSDSCLAFLPSLQEFYINHNLISSISPGAFRGLGGLLRLHLNSNRLTIIDRRWFQPLPDLDILMLGENPILTLTEMNFKPLANLRSLVLAKMNLTEIPADAFVGLENLESISFFDNLLDRVPRAALSRVQSLKFLDLNKNPIERIQRGDFMDMLHLKELGINSMPQLISIDSFALNNLPELTKVEATNNPRLSYIHPRAFHNLPRLETLMLNSNALSALHRSIAESLPNLREVSLHSNPIRCDCVIRWVNMNGTSLRFMEPDSLFCADPPEYEGQRVRQVHFREMTETCLPLISPGSLPHQVALGKGKISSVSLHCRAFGEPEPDIYWVTPRGVRLLPGSASDKHYVHPEGTLELYDATEQEAGSYTCIAHNLVGADLKSVMVAVDGFDARPSNQSLRVCITSVQSQSVMVSWQNLGGLVSQLNWSLLVGGPSSPFTARLPADVDEYHIKKLTPSTSYQICVEVTAAQLGYSMDCVNVTTKEAAAPKEEPEGWDRALTAAAAVLIIAAAVSVIYTSLYRKLRADPAGTLLIPSSSPLLEFAVSGVKVRATVIDLGGESM